jgi:transcriptional regulator with XRE-family HTH domain
MDFVLPIRPDTVKRLREERAWSQERLAEASGLSPRTIQRLERDGKASPESRLALASALGVDVTTLGGIPMEEPVGAALKGDHGQARFWAHLVKYLGGCLLFLCLDLFPDGSLDWAFWPMLGWGTAVLLHALKVWRRGFGAGLDQVAD